MSGRWVRIESSNVEKEKTVTITTSMSDSREKTESWETSVVKSAEMGVEFKGVSGSYSASTSEASSTVTSIKQVLSLEKTETNTVSYQGVLWQFQYVVEQHDCGTSSILTNDIAVTKNASTPPCCLPGYAKNEDDLQGACIDSSEVCFCELDVCFPPSESPTTSPNESPSRSPTPGLSLSPTTKFPTAPSSQTMPTKTDTFSNPSDAAAGASSQALEALNVLGLAATITYLLLVG